MFPCLTGKRKVLRQRLKNVEREKLLVGVNHADLAPTDGSILWVLIHIREQQLFLTFLSLIDHLDHLLQPMLLRFQDPIIMLYEPNWNKI
jgi:hypothetical protein